MFCNGVTRKNARACGVCAIFNKMLKITWNVCKITLRRFWAFNFFARALTRGRTRTRAFFWPEIDRTDIDLDHDKYEWEITFGYEDMNKSWFSENFTKWRLDDVISQGQGWKRYCDFSICLYICVPNFKLFDLDHFKLSCSQKSGEN